LNKYIPALVLQQWIEKYVKETTTNNQVENDAKGRAIAVTEVAKE